ncbi:MAG: Trk system potassium transporter TrkA [Oscillospiraceae bacterium]|nr:Trk system potassium transporter TrkA [Oscillospiraceae bacterium]
MKIVIVGDGKVGYTLTSQLLKEGHDIVVIDNNPDVLEDSLEKLDVMVVNGNGATLKTQTEADVANSDLLIAATSADEVNLLCCFLARKLGCRHTICRVRNPDYAQSIQFMREDFGLSMTVNPELAAAREIFRMLQFPSFLKRDAFAKGRVEIVELKISSESALVGRKLEKLSDILRGVKVLVCAVERGDNVYIPDGSFVFEANDKITVTAPRSELVKLIKALKVSNQKIKDVIIIGGSRIAVYLSDDLIKSGVNVKIIEQNLDKCRLLSERLPNAVIINGDGTLQDFLISEGIEETDAVVSLTNIDEENLIISMYADHCGVSKTVTKIDRTEYIHLFRDKGIGSVVCPKMLTSYEIIRYVRAMENTTGGSVKTLHRIVDEKVEALEFAATHNTKYLGEPLKKIKLKNNILIACINRMGRIIIPSGNDYISAGDTVIVVTTADRKFSDINDVFSEN